MAIRLAVLSLFAAAGSAAAQTTCQYIGPANGLWSQPVNWGCGVVPVNDGPSTFNVIVPGGASVVFDLPGPAAVTGASFESGSSIALAGTSLEILGVALLENMTIGASGPGAAFITNAPFTSGNNQMAQLDSGAHARLALSSYFWTNDWSSTTVFSVDGVGSVLDMSETTLFDASNASTGGTSYTYTVVASGGGLIDLSSVVTVKGAGGNEWLRFRAESGGVVDLGSLAQTSAGRTWFEPAGGVIRLDSLNSVLNTTLGAVRDGETLSLPSLTSATNTTISIDPNGAVDAPLLTVFYDSTLTLTPSRTLNAPAFVEIDNSRLTIAEGQHLAVADDEYLWTNDWTTTTLLSADGAGTRFDLSSLELIDASAAATGGTAYDYTIAASAGAELDLSNVVSVKGAGGNERLAFVASSGGSIDLSALETADGGQTRFRLDGGSLLLPSLATVEGGYFTVPIFEVLDLPGLAAARSTTLDIEAGGTLNAPLLTDFTASTVSLTPSTFLNAPPFELIDNARLHVAGGRSYAVAASSYAWTNDWTNTTVMSSDGVGSVLDLSSIESMDASQASTGGTSYTYAITASNAGAIDLTGLTTVQGAGGNEWLAFQAIEEGECLLGEPNQTGGRLLLHAANPGSKVHASGDVALGIDGGSAGVRATLLGEFHARGDWIYNLNGGFHDCAGGSMVLDGDGRQRFEVAGADLGVPDDAISDNYEWGAMVVGRTGQPNTVLLVDSVDNGNRGGAGEPEALYLTGFPQGDDGLRILGGATLVLNDLQLYVGTVGGWVHINALFGPDDFRIPYDGGFIQIRECLADWNGDQTVNTQDFLAYLNSWTSGDPAADVNGDGSINTQDFLVFLGLWAAGCA